MAAPNAKMLIRVGHAAVLLAAAQLCAQDGFSKWRFGVEGSLAVPMRGASEIASNGFGAGIFAERGAEKNRLWGLTLDSAWGLSAGYVRLGEKKWDGAAHQSMDASIDNASLQLYSAIRFISAGVFLHVGLGFGYANIHTGSGPDFGELAYNTSIGVGYGFNEHFGIVAKIMYSGYRGSDYPKSPSPGNYLQYMQFGAQYRF